VSSTGTEIRKHPCGSSLEAEWRAALEPRVLQRHPPSLLSATAVSSLVPVTAIMLDILLLNSKKFCEDIDRCRWLCSWHVQSWHWHWLMCFGVRSYITSFVLESCFQIFYEHSKSVEVSYDLHEVASYSIWFACCRASWLDWLGPRLPSFCEYANCNPSLVVFKAAWVTKSMRSVIYLYSSSSSSSLSFFRLGRSLWNPCALELVQLFC